MTLEPRAKPHKPSKRMRAPSMTGSKVIGGNGGKGKKKKTVEDVPALSIVEVGKRSKTPSLEAVKRKNLLGQGSSSEQKLCSADKKVDTAKSSKSLSHKPEAKIVGSKSELEAAGALAGLKLKKVGKKSGVRIVDALEDDDGKVDFLDDNLSLASPLRGLLEDKVCNVSVEKDLRSEGAGTMDATISIPLVIPEVKQAPEQVLPCHAGNPDGINPASLSFADLSGACSNF